MKIKETYRKVSEAHEKIASRMRCATNADCRPADWQINIVLKCSNPNPNPNPKRLALGLIRVSVRVRVRVRASLQVYSLRLSHTALPL